MIKNPIKKAGVLAVAISAIISSPSFAELEEIIVSAQKRDQSISDVPMSIEAASEDTLKEKAIFQVREIAAASPSLTTASSFGGVGTVFSGRGIIGSTNLDPSISFYIDDLPYFILGFGIAPTANLADIQRAEIINGPQGTLYGQGAMGGTIRVITNDPDSTEFSGKVRMSGSTTKDGDPSYGGDVVVNVPLIEDKLALRAVYSQQRQGGYLDAINVAGGAIDDINDATYEDLRVKVMATPTDELTIKGSYWKGEGDSPYGNLGDFDAPASNTDGDNRTFEGLFVDGNDNTIEQDAYTLSVNYDFDSFSVYNSLSYLDAHQGQLNTALGANGFVDLEATSLANELRFTSNSDGALNWIGGYYYQNAKSDTELDISLTGGAAALLISSLNAALPPAFQLPPLDPIEVSNSSSQRESTVHAAFGEVTYELSETVEVLVGLRYFHDNRTAFSTATATDLAFIVGTPVDVDLDLTFDSWNPRFNVTVRPTEDSMLYVNIAKGFRSGTFNLGGSILAAQTVGVPNVVENFTIIEPDQVWSYELGGRYTSPDGLFSLRGAVFYEEWSDAQTLVNFNPLLFAGTITNLGTEIVTGLEYGVTVNPTDNLSLSVDGVYLDARYEDIDLEPVAATFLQGIEKGGNAIGTPKSQVSAAVTYNYPMDNGLNLNFTTNYTYRSSQTDATGAPLKVGGIQNVNTRLTLSDDESWDVSLFVNNVTDEDDVTDIAFQFFATQPRPREIGLDVSYNF